MEKSKNPFGRAITLVVNGIIFIGIVALGIVLVATMYQIVATSLSPIFPGIPGAW